MSTEEKPIPKWPERLAQGEWQCPACAQIVRYCFDTNHDEQKILLGIIQEHTTECKAYPAARFRSRARTLGLFDNIPSFESTRIPAQSGQPASVPRCHCGQEVLRDSLRVHNSRGEHTRVQGETCSPVAPAPEADKPAQGYQHAEKRAIESVAAQFGVSASPTRETPRTDAAVRVAKNIDARRDDYWEVMAKALHQTSTDLERQLAEAKAKLGVWSEEELRMAEARAAEAQATFWNENQQLRTERDEARAELADTNSGYETACKKLAEATFDRDSLRARLAALEADGQRLDWLEKQLQDNQSVDQLWKDSRCTDDLRSAIDAAMKGEKE